MAKGEIRVQLTPEGVEQVLAAFRRVQTEAVASSNRTRTGVEGLRTSLVTLRRVLGALGIATSIAGFVQLGRAALKSSKEIVDASRQIGISAREFTRLRAAIRLTKGDVDALDPAITNLRRNLSRALADPNSEAARAFQQLRINAEELAKLPIEQQLAEIADKVSLLRGEEDQLRGTTDILGKGADGLVTSLRGGGDEFSRLADEGERVGRVMSDETAVGINKATGAVERLRDKLRGLFQRELGRRSSQLEGLLGRFGVDLSATAGAAPVDRRAAPDDPRGTLAIVETPEQRRAALAILRERIDQELALQQERNKQRQEADEAAYNQGLISLEDYYARRLAATRAAGEAEIAALTRQLAIVQASPAEDEDERRKRAAEAEKLRHEIALRRLRTETTIAALAAEQTTEQKRLDEQWVQTLGRIDELEGRRHEAFQRNLAEEVRQIEELGRKAGQTAEEIATQVGRFTAASTARETFDVAISDARSKLEAFDQDAQRIQLEQEAGIITQLEGENRLIALQRQRLEQLREIAAAAKVAAEATRDPAAIAQAEQFAASVAQIELSFIAATNAAGRLRQGLETGLQQGFVDLATNIDEIHSLEDAFSQLAVTVARSLAQIAAEILAKQATFALLRAFGSAFGGGATGAAAPGGYKGGVVEGYAGGGKVRGRRLNIPGPDKVPALLQDGEFVVRRSVASRPGMMQVLRDLNAAKFSPAELMRPLALRRFAEGGPVNLAAVDVGGSSSGRNGPGLAGVLGLEEGLVFKHLESPAFEELILKRISRRPTTFRSALGL